MSTAPQIIADDARAAMQSTDVADRVALASRNDIPKEYLVFLAADLAPEVRRLIALNPASPLAADLILVRDREEEVRDGLIDKTVDRIPGNSESDPEPLKDLLVEILDILADDDSDAVRLALSEAISEMRYAPISTIRRLAEDDNPKVAGPVLVGSPLLGEADLLASIERYTSEFHLDAIAGRKLLPGSVTDALIELGQDSSVQTLLTNPSIQLREAALDQILEQAPNHPSWHGPLVNHPNLPRHGADALATYIVQSLVEALDVAEGKRCDLVSQTATLIKERIENTGAEIDDPLVGDEPDTAQAEPEVPAEEVNLRVLIEGGYFDQLAAELGKRAQLKQATVAEILASAAPRGVLALAWAAGLSVNFAVTLQSQVARIPPNATMTANKDGDYPLSKEEMSDQLKFFGAKVAKRL